MQVEQGNKVVIVDPVAGWPICPGAKRADLILVTDIHQDHLDAAAVAKLRKPGAPVVVPQAVGRDEADPGRHRDAEPHDANQRTGAGRHHRDLRTRLQPHNAAPSPGQLYHTRDRGQGYYLAFTDKLAVVREKKAGSVYVAGDTECVPAIAQWVKDVDVALLPMNLPYTMTPAEAAEVREGFRPRVVIPYHYMGQKPEEFAAARTRGNDDRGSPAELLRERRRARRAGPARSRSHRER